MWVQGPNISVRFMKVWRLRTGPTFHHCFSSCAPVPEYVRQRGKIPLSARGALCGVHVMARALAFQTAAGSTSMRKACDIRPRSLKRETAPSGKSRCFIWRCSLSKTGVLWLLKWNDWQNFESYRCLFQAEDPEHPLVAKCYIALVQLHFSDTMAGWMPISGLMVRAQTRSFHK